eukprot:12711065-Alexandrium_andersonii.AAC.1
MATIPGGVVLRLKGDLHCGHSSPLWPSGYDPGRICPNAYWRVVQFIPALCGIAVYSSCRAYGTVVLSSHRVERVATSFHAAFRVA